MTMKVRKRTMQNRLEAGIRFGLLACAVLCAASLRGQERDERAGATSEAPAEGAAKDAAAEQARLEEVFREALSGATLTGRWRTIRDGVLGEEREETYSISSATKTAGDLWIIVARVQYGDKDVTLPVPVRVRWAGDTPVISVTDAGLPGLGTYTARVLVYRDVYSGAWFGPGVTGTLSGTIRRDGDQDAQKDAEKNAEKNEEASEDGRPDTSPSPQPDPDDAKEKENEEADRDETSSREAA